jgi:hypothetical protein
VKEMADDSELFRIHRKANTAKAIENLIGILKGLTADRALNEIEILFLDTWLKENQFLRSDPDAIDILDCISDLKNFKQPPPEAIADLFDLLTQIVEYRQLTPFKSEFITQSNTLCGLIQGMMSDRSLNDSEIFSLNEWLRVNNTNEWPASALRLRLTEILADGVISESERLDLIDLLQKCGPQNLHKLGTPEIGPITLGTCEPDTIHFDAAAFCFTGTFVRGTRRTCERLVEERGGFTSSTVTKRLNYLVLGTLPTRDWITSSFGRKIHKAISLQNEGHPIQIVTEAAWSRFL